MVTSLLITLILLVCFLGFALWRLNKYIGGLERFIEEELIKRMDIYEDTLRTVIKEEYIKPDMSIKKTLFSNDEN